MPSTSSCCSSASSADWYGPQTGRFLSQDPIGLAGGVNLYAYAANNPTSYSDPFGLSPDSVEVRWHEVAKGKYHTSIRISPEDQARWASDPRFKKGSDGRVSLTLSAGPKACLPQGVCLVSDRNRKSDAGSQAGTVQVDLKGQDENKVIERLLRADATYGDNLGYDPLPKRGEYRFNSNSYTSGTLIKAGTQPPAVPVDAPGYDDPIP